MAGDLPHELPASASHVLQDWLSASNSGRITCSRQLGGGANNGCYQLDTDTGISLVAKVSSFIEPERWQAEADGLALIADTRAIRCPEVYHVDEQCLLLEYIPAAQQATDYWIHLAQQLARMHNNTQPQGLYGLKDDNFCGANAQLNGWFEDGYVLFGEQRLLYQARLAYDNGYLESPWIIHIETICERLPELVPLQPPSLLHGDLWPGNILVDDYGEPALIDPAVYYGWREADIAMSLLFGGLPHEFYLAYEQAWPMENDWRSRVPLYNLYHLLNHLNIFGVSYQEQVQQTIARYA